MPDPLPLDDPIDAQQARRRRIGWAAMLLGFAAVQPLLFAAARLGIAAAARTPPASEPTLGQLLCYLGALLAAFGGSAIFRQCVAVQEQSHRRGRPLSFAAMALAFPVASLTVFLLQVAAGTDLPDWTRVGARVAVLMPAWLLLDRFVFPGRATDGASKRAEAAVGE